MSSTVLDNPGGMYRGWGYHQNISESDGYPMSWGERKQWMHSGQWGYSESMHPDSTTAHNQVRVI